ncbi:tRNA1(Val) (adenine(37)-N6)-methyltransferase [Arachidicoccus terrestris]|uniref:tRNA1(Val) (adenine(37)-N6)-methyltransferase n=1 Tax=Arachidicoccus terrestris TaxID=2875539 RepID=UPI001CC54EF8|nr:methyltransferase [Arachidicoccus terrestris]UAY56729.1 methyltransferase [Arachidicoccus terrestris]
MRKEHISGIRAAVFAYFCAMGNDFFRFKQFEVKQGKTAMKVCTDSCLFGALLPCIDQNRTRILDIGTGTGLLSLMYAQRHADAQIDAIELDEAAFEQAKENFAVSPWPDRLTAIQADFRSYGSIEENNIAKYDLIFSNPPFFEGDLKSADNQRNQALHSTDLGFEGLVRNTEALLQPEGIFAVLIPFSRREEMIRIAKEYTLFPYLEYIVAHTQLHDYFRVIQLFSRKELENHVEEILIRDLKQQYSLKFRELLNPFYLYL